MAHERLTLDNPIFAETLRQTRRSVPAYRSRPTHPQTAQDMMFVRSASQAPVLSKPEAAHSSVIRPKKPVTRDVPLRVRSAAPSRKAQPSAAKAPKQKTKPKRRIRGATAVLYILAAVLFIAGGYIAFSSLRTDVHVKAQVKQLEQAVSDTSSSNDTPTAEKPSTSAVRNYTVAPALARYLDIPKLKVHARVLPLGIKSDNTLKAPRNGYDVGWYDASSRPGENGAMLIDGHSNVLGKNAVFARLGKLVVGDSVKVTRGDGTIYSYKVRSVETVDDDKVDMGSLLISADTAKPGLNLITCAGDVIPGTLHLDKRTLVRAVLE